METTHPAFMLHQISQHIDKLEEDKAELLDLLKAAVARVELANTEGDSILSAWVNDAEAAISKARPV